MPRLQQRPKQGYSTVLGGPWVRRALSFALSDNVADELFTSVLAVSQDPAVLGAGGACAREASRPTMPVLRLADNGKDPRKARKRKIKIRHVHGGLDSLVPCWAS
jgi:hypothetical protein